MAHTRRTIPSLFAASLLILTLVFVPHVGAATSATPPSSALFSQANSPHQGIGAPLARLPRPSDPRVSAIRPADNTAPTITMTLLASLAVGAPATPFSATLTNPMSGTAYPSVRVDFTIRGSQSTGIADPAVLRHR